MATGQAAAGNDVVYTCALGVADGAVSCISPSGKLTVVPVPAGQDPFGDWLLEPLLEVARLQLGQRLVVMHGPVVVGEYSHNRVISSSLAHKYRKELSSEPPKYAKSGKDMDEADIADRKRKLAVYFEAALQKTIAKPKGDDRFTTISHAAKCLREPKHVQERLEIIAIQKKCERKRAVICFWKRKKAKLKTLLEQVKDPDKEEKLKHCINSISKEIDKREQEERGHFKVGCERVKNLNEFASKQSMIKTGA